MPRNVFFLSKHVYNVLLSLNFSKNNNIAVPAHNTVVLSSSLQLHNRTLISFSNKHLTIYESNEYIIDHW